MEKEETSVLTNLIRRFTVTDFLGYLIPGAIVTLSWEQRFDGMLKTPFTDFFGEQTVLLALYFLVLSYLVGTVIHEFSKPLDHLTDQFLTNKLVEREKEGDTLHYYNQLFHAFSPEDQKKETTDGGGTTADATEKQAKDHFEKIYHWVQPYLNNTKVPLFRAFSTLGRTGAVTVLLVAFLYWTDPSRQPFAFDHVFVLQACFVIFLFVLLMRRSYRFKKTSMKYIYDIFDAICIKTELSSLLEKRDLQ